VKPFHEMTPAEAKAQWDRLYLLERQARTDFVRGRLFRVEEESVERRVERVIEDLAGHKITPAQVDRLGQAVDAEREKVARDRAVGRAIR